MTHRLLSQGRVIGTWPVPGFPERIRIGARTFRRIDWIWPVSSGVVVQYREDANSERAAALMVLENGEVSLVGANNEEKATDVKKEPMPLPEPERRMRKRVEEPAAVPPRGMLAMALGAGMALLGIGIISLLKRA